MGRGRVSTQVGSGWTSLLELQDCIFMVSAIWHIIEISLVILAGVLGLSLFYAVHCGLDRCCVGHARRFCRRRGYSVRRCRWQPEFKLSRGKRLKTEYTLVQLDCLDSKNERRLIILLVWPFGVRKTLSNEEYPESYEKEWPQARDDV